MIYHEWKSLSVVFFAVGFLLMGSISAQQQKAAAQKANIAGKSEEREDSEEKIRLKDLPKAVQAAVQKETRDSQIVGISREIENGKTLYEIETRLKGHSRDMLFDAGGNLTEVEEEIALTSLPANIQAEAKKSIGKARLVKLEAVYNGAKILSGYSALLESAGKQSEISMGLDGKLLTGAR